ncbi:MAG: ABC transporter ATP-binding protein [Clostridia bacterium]|nr:ABC transporter ATP-binding protein [Clostridia bacterium]
MKDTILSVTDLCVDFHLRGKTLHALRGVSLDVAEGESLAIVGESGSGKSVLNKNFIGLLDANGEITGGSIRYYGMGDKLRSTPEGGMDEEGRAYVELTRIPSRNKDWLRIRGSEICMIPQDPMTSLNPLKRIGAQISEALLLHHGMKGQMAYDETIRILEDVQIDHPQERYRQYPHELSGGQRQRIVIAIAIACQPKILICDEPTTALDVTVQAQVLSLLHQLKDKYRLTILFITHDLGVVANIADRVAVMYAGDIVEVGTSEEIFFDPRHPYTWALLSSLPQLGERGEELFTIRGTPPSLFTEITGDAFAMRNPQALMIDHRERPPYFSISPTHRARTWLLDPRAPKMERPGVLDRIKELGGKTDESKS